MFIDLTPAILENALINLVRAVHNGVWYEIDLSIELAKEALGFDPTQLVEEEI